MSIITASDGAEALDVLKRSPVDVILLDIMMPKVDGWMALMDIRNSPAFADLPVIMLSAKTQDLAKILAANMTWYIEWPHIDGRFVDVFSTLAGYNGFAGHRG